EQCNKENKLDINERELVDVALTLEKLKNSMSSSTIQQGKENENDKKRKIEENSNFESPAQQQHTKMKQKKKRRKRNEIERNFKCPFHGCSKSYGSEGALKTHTKLKHLDDSLLSQ